MAKVAVVTGANRGLGLQVAKDLARDFDGLVYLTSRDEARGRSALASAQAALGPKGSKLRFHQLDVDSQSSVEALRDFLRRTHGRLDVLVNNAGVGDVPDSTVPLAEQAKATMRTNYFGARRVCEALFPLLAPGARVVNVASRLGTVTLRGSSRDVASRIASAKSVEEVDQMMKEYVTLTQSGGQKAAGWTDLSYGVAKLGLIAVSEIQGKALAADRTRPDIALNACCPGFVSTDMTARLPMLKSLRLKTVAEEADTPAFLALLPPGDPTNPKGRFVGERRVIDWRKGQRLKEAFGRISKL